MKENELLLETKGLTKTFRVKKKNIFALNQVSVNLKKQYTTALVGESGCGKTTFARCVLGFYQVDQGEIIFKKEDISDVRRRPRALCKEVQIVFQNPFLSFDSRYTMFSSLYEPLQIWQVADRKMARTIMVDLLENVGLDANFLNRYPHQLSGGELQRVSLARALINAPHLVVLDEPTSSLDIATTAKIIRLLEELQKKYRVTYLFISHNIKLVKRIAHFVYVMYLGKIVESGRLNAVFSNPVHPYTQKLLAASEYKLEDKGYVVPAANQGCPFGEECARYSSLCTAFPRAKEIEPEHIVFCHKV